MIIQEFRLLFKTFSYVSANGFWIRRLGPYQVTLLQLCSIWNKTHKRPTIVRTLLAVVSTI